MRPSQIARLRWTALQALAGGLFWLAYVNTMHALGFIQLAEPIGWRIFLAGACIFGASAAFEFYVYRTAWGAPIRRLPLLLSLAVHFAILLVLAGAILAAIRLPTYYEQLATLGEAAARPRIMRDAVLVVIVAFAFIVWSEIRALIGPRTLINLILGKYRTPRRERRIFLFVDVVGSTSIAAQIGDERFHAYLSRFFFDIDEAVVDLGGEINSYVGDAAIITWPLSSPDKNADAISAAFAIQAIAERTAAQFEDAFGVRIRIRAALHGGSVVAGECGDSKRQITYLGDVVNVAARLEQAAKQMGHDIVVSTALLNETQLPDGIVALELGAIELKGLAQPINVTALKSTRTP